ncbi:MAG: tetratricopeptide repeat protein, partial [Bacteroidetes bacterium]
MFRILIFLTLAFIAPTLQAQSEYTTLKNAPEKAQKYFNLGMDMLYNKRPAQALRYFDKALNIRPDFIDAQIFKAGAMTQTDNWTEAEKGFEAVLNIAPNYDIEVYYDLGMVKYHLKKYGEAGLLFQKYLDAGPKNERRKNAALEFIEKTRFIADYEKKPFDFHPKNLGPNINNAGDQYLPALTADGNTLIYSAVVGGGYGQEDFFQSKKVNGVWQKGTPLSAVNTE